MLTLLFWAEEEDSSRTSVIRMIRSGGDGMMDGSPIHTRGYKTGVSYFLQN